MVLANTDGSDREVRELKIWLAGNDRRVVKFLSPPGIEGVGLLTEADGSLYLYLPAQNRIRRIAGSVENEEFQGTDFSYNEMASYTYTDEYTATVSAEDAATWTLILTKKTDSDRVYDRLVMTVEKATSVPRRIELYKKGRCEKILTLTEIRREGKYLIPVKIRMENLIKQHYTEMTLTEVVFDQGLVTQGVFTKRFLKKQVR
ncbi:MAG TPA: outer membrane lipoprotein-sorting protein [Spirochaetia bacterium]|nr:outer membrane lipoprotein-sorting protein [Spirochaetia bacterium]